MAGLGFAIAMLLNFQVSSLNKSEKELPLQVMVQNAQASGEFDPIGSCNDWCIDDPLDVCWLILSNGVDLYCHGWDEPFN